MVRLSSFTRTWLGLCVITAPVIGGVLPEDRADVMYHYYNGGDITVEGPSVLIRKKVGDSLSFTVNYYEDMISSASIDVKLSASPYHEKRTQWSGGVDYLHGKSTYSAGVITSDEPDYKANTAFVSVSLRSRRPSTCVLVSPPSMRKARPTFRCCWPQTT